MALTDKNLYAYCDNNPIMRVDNGGEFWNFIIGGVVGAIVGGVTAALNGEDVAGIIIGATAGAISGVVAATGLGAFAQAGISAGVSALAEFANQTVDVITDENIEGYDVGSIVTETVLGFGTSLAGSLAGNIFDKKITKNMLMSDKMYDLSLEKTFTAGLRKESGRSTSALLRQAEKFVARSDYYRNVYRGISSVIGSVISLWNIAR